MSIFDRLINNEFEQVIFFNNKKTNLKAIIAIHDTSLGPAVGGCRMKNYPSVAEALDDVLRLAEGMTYKAAGAGLNYGGGKAVIIGDPNTDKTEDLLKSFAECVNSLDGKYIVSKDLGTTVDDLKIFNTVSEYVVGMDFDPSFFTAYGVFNGIKASLDFKYKDYDWEDISVAVQGVGGVGYGVIELLAQKKCKIYAADVSDANLQRVVNDFNVIPVKLDEIYEIEADVFSPCAIGQIINPQNIEKFKVKIIAGSANNQLQSPEDIELLRAKDILYAPDYVINAGGLVCLMQNVKKEDTAEVNKQSQIIYDRLTEIYTIAEKDNLPTSEVANMFVHERLKQQS